jgi:hypothetical protein
MLETPINAARRRYAGFRTLALSRGMSPAVFALAEREWAGIEASDAGRVTPNAWDHVNAALAVANSARLLPGFTAPVIARAMQAAT